MILVSGATGLIGGLVTRALIAQGEQPRLMVRRPIPHQHEQWPQAQVIAADLDRPSSLKTALQGVHAALLVSPSTPEMVRQQSAFVTAAARLSTVTQPIHIVKISGFLTALDSPSQSGRWHAQVEALTKHTDLPATFLRMPYFMQNLLHLVPSPVGTGVLRSPLPTARIAMVDARDIAAVATCCLRNAQQYSGQHYLLTGPSAVSMTDVATHLSAICARPVSHQPETDDKHCQRLIAEGTPAWRIKVVREFNSNFESGAGEPLSNTVHQITGAKPRSMHQFIKDHLMQF